MVNYIWFGMMLLSFLSGILNQCLPDVVVAVTDGLRASVDMMIGVFGLIVFWSGIMKIAEHSGLVQVLGQLMRKPVQLLFPEIPEHHPALGEIVMTTIAFAFGLNNAAIPLGIRAMKQLDTLNDKKGEATHAMCMLVTINASSIQLIPVSTIGMLAMCHADDPIALIVPTTIASLCSMVGGIMFVLWMKKRNPEEGIKK